jgi:hypothetical protein
MICSYPLNPLASNSSNQESASGNVSLVNQVFSTNTFAVSTNGVFNLPTAGKYVLRYDLSTDGTGANTNSQFAIFNGAGVVVAGSERARGGGITTAQALTAEVEVSISAAETFTLKARNGGSGSNSVTIISSAVSQSTISWKQIGSASVGQTAITDNTASHYVDIGNMRLQWGNHNDNNVDTTTVTLPALFANTDYVVNAISNSGGSLSVAAEAKTTSTFDLDRSSSATSTQTWGWFAIGQKP